MRQCLDIELAVISHEYISSIRPFGCSLLLECTARHAREKIHFGGEENIHAVSIRETSPVQLQRTISRILKLIALLNIPASVCLHGISTACKHIETRD